MKNQRRALLSFGLKCGFAFVLLLPSAAPALAAQGDCSQPVTSGSKPTASDCLFILKVAVGTETCEPLCVCAPQDGVPVLSSDALRCLRRAVGQEVPLDCGCTEGHSFVRVHYPAESGDQVVLRGTGGGLSTQVGKACQESPTSVWTCDLGVVAGEVLFKPWLNNSVAAAGTDYRLTAPGEIDVFPFFFATEGRVEIVEDFASALLGNMRDVAVYLPPSYDENPDKNYPVLLMQDGQNLFDATTAFGGVEWGVDEAMDALARNGAIVETIVVAPYNTPDRIDEYTPTFDSDFGTGGGADDYLDFLLEELLPEISELYRIDPAAQPGIAGSSLGGLLGMYGAWTRHPPFARVAALSPSLYWDDAYVNTLIAGHAGAKVPLRIYLDVGSAESNAALVPALRDILISKGWVLGDDLSYVFESGGTHSETAWAARTPGALAFLLRDPDRIAP